MIGRPLSSVYPVVESQPGRVLLQTSHLSRVGAFADISLSLRAGEIVGLGGLVGSGRTEIARVLFGIDQPDDGEIRIEGNEVSFARPADAMRAGIAYVSEDRLGQSLVMAFSILSNAVLPILPKASTVGIVRRLREIAQVGPQLDRMRLKYRSYDQAAKTLSGGNQQKVVLAKWLATTPRVLILDEPTQGIDVQSKAEVHMMIAELARHGMAILLISSELPELIGMCNRILVLREGHLTASFEGATVTQEQVIRAATDADSGSNQSTRWGQEPLHQTDAEVPLLRRLTAHRELGLVLAIAAVSIPAALINQRFLSPANLTALAMDAALLTIVAAAQMLVMLTRNIDLSVASVIGLAAYGSASFIHIYPDAGVLAGVGIACAIGLGCGALNGLIVTLGNVPSIVVTLGSLAIFRGFNSIWAGGKQISADQVPQDWLDMTSTRLAGIPGVILIAVTVLVVIGIGLYWLPKGRQLYAVGSNPDGASLVGIRSTLLVFTAFCIAGLLAGFDGALWASRYATIDARVAIGYELTVIATVVVGGVAVRGGLGTIPGVALGSVLLLFIQNGLTLARVDPLWLQGVYGLVILGAVAVDALASRRIRRDRGKAP
jgi:ribose/xylose/arabinose/galactoside ABC-type transport system permease subunit/ABC-type multidrug transport system ATPase subunit